MYGHRWKRLFASSRFAIAHAILYFSLDGIRRVSPGCKVDLDDLKALLQNEVLKRDLFDGEEAKQAAEFLKKAARSAERAKKHSSVEEAPEADAGVKSEPEAGGEAKEA